MNTTVRMRVEAIMQTPPHMANQTSKRTCDIRAASAFGGDGLAVSCDDTDLGAASFVATGARIPEPGCFRAEPLPAGDGCFRPLAAAGVFCTAAGGVCDVTAAATGDDWLLLAAELSDPAAVKVPMISTIINSVHVLVHTGHHAGTYITNTGAHTDTVTRMREHHLRYVC